MKASNPTGSEMNRQQISDRFSFLEGIVNEHNYRLIVDAATEIYDSALQAQLAQQVDTDVEETLKRILARANLRTDGDLDTLLKRVEDMHREDIDTMNGQRTIIESMKFKHAGKRSYGTDTLSEYGIFPMCDEPQSTQSGSQKPCKCGVCAECNWAKSHPDDGPALHEEDEA